MAGGGGIDTMSDQDQVSAIDKLSEATANIQPPAWARQTVPGITNFSLDENRSRDLDNYYRDATMKLAQSMLPQDPMELTRNITDAVGRSNAQGRLPDPDYDLQGKAGVDYRSLQWTPDSITALATQRANDYLSDALAKADAQSRELSRSQQDLLLRQRQDFETKRLTDAAKNDQATRDQARQSRVNKLVKGGFRFPAGSSLLALDDPDNQITTGTSALASK